MAMRNTIITLADLRAKREEILDAAATRGASRVRVLDSVARADARANSDVDFLVEFEPGRNVADLSELMLNLEEILDRAVHVIDANSSARGRNMRDAVPL
jgi:predicted nucleotidyltransferase